MSSAATDVLQVTPPTQRLQSGTELEAFNQIVSAIRGVPEETQMRLMKSVLTFLGWTDPISKINGENSALVGPPRENQSKFSEDRSQSPKEFMHQKRPLTDTEKIACLAFYLSHFRNSPHFKTLDLSKLNTEAAQIKLSNPTVAVNNAAASGLLVPAGNGKKQISSLGEAYVQALPDREAAKAALAHARPRRKSRGNSTGEPNSNGTDEAE